MDQILFLDDMEERHHAFEGKYGDKFEIIHAWDYEDFIKQMTCKLYKFETVFLDHDLSTKSIMCDPETYDEEKTGSDAAKWMVKYFGKAEDRPNVIVHSLNPAGRKNIGSILRDAGFKVSEVPFFYII